MRRHRSTKIIATLGPSSATEAGIEKLFLAGVDAFRLNCSHGTHADHEELHGFIRSLEEKTGRPISIILDLQGPKLRIGSFQDQAITLQEGQIFSLDTDPKLGDENRVFLPHPEIFEAVQRGGILLLDDGKVRLSVETATPDLIRTRVMMPGSLSNNKGLNLPSLPLALSPMTPKDRVDLAFGLGLGVEWVALSFVQHPSDILEARSLIGDQAGIISKLEKPLAIDHLEEIVRLSDALMVARGDLGVEMPPEDVPSLQKRIIRCCRQAGRPVVVATQMLDSMVTSPTPTRAEASDVATAVYDGADAVMLSAESASGDYPVESVEMMNRIITRVEQDSFFCSLQNTTRPDPTPTTADAITAAARHIATTLDLAAIVTFTTSGGTTLKAARERPEAPILALTPKLSTTRKLALVWGVHAVKSREVSRFVEVVSDACSIATKEGFAKPGDRIVVTAGVPFQSSGSTNSLHIADIEG